MRYVLLLESAYDNGKLCSFSHRAFRLWANSLSYSRKHKTDGHLSPAQVEVLLRLYRLSKRDVDELVAKGGWEQVGDGHAIHDFLEVNPAEDELGAVSESRSEAGRQGGLRSAAARRAKAQANASKQTPQQNEANRNKKEIEKRELEEDVDPAPSEHGSDNRQRPAIEAPISRAGEAAIVPFTDRGPRSEHVALLTAAQIAFGRAGQTETEKRQDRERIHELVLAGVTPDEFGELVAEYRRRGWPNPSLKSLVKNLSGLRAPYEAGHRGSDRDEPRGFDGLRAAYADLDPRRHAHDAATGA